MSLQRQVQIVAPPEATDALLAEIRELPDLLGLQLQRGGSLQPPGDVITAQVKNQSLHRLMQLLDRRGIGRDTSSSFSTSFPASIISPSAAAGLGTETSDATWEEMELEMGKESNMTINGLLVMVISGVLATVGIATNALHVVLGAMVIAPGFEPITRIVLGVVGRSDAWRRGLLHTAKAYLALMAGAAAAALLLRAAGIPLPSGEATYLPAGSLAPYWTSFSVPSLLASSVAAVGGAVLIATNRAVLTSGVMIALALIPTAALVPIALIAGESGLAGWALLRWAAEVGLVLAASAVVFVWKRARVQRRNMLL